MTLKEQSKIKYDTTKRSTFYCLIIQVDCTSQTLKMNNKLYTETFVLGRHGMTLNDLSKVKSDTNRFTAYGFRDCSLQSSRTNNRQDKSTFMIVQVQVVGTVRMESKP